MKKKSKKEQKTKAPKVVENVEVEEQAPEATPEELLQQCQDQLLRKTAEFDNFRKRMQKELMDTRTNAGIAVIENFLTVYDHFKMAMQYVNSEDITTMQKGMEMIFSQFERTFEGLGVKESSTVGQEFDPNLHEAVSHETSDEVPEGSIIKEWKSGYSIDDRLIRPAMVVVSSGPEGEATDEPETEDNTEQVK